MSSHPESGVVILSLWTGDTCTGTFRVPMADAAGLIATLADGMAQSIPADECTHAGRGARPARLAGPGGPVRHPDPGRSDTNLKAS